MQILIYNLKSLKSCIKSEKLVIHFRIIKF